MNEWLNTDPQNICDICRLQRAEPPTRPKTDWNEQTGNHVTCEEFMVRDGK